MIILNTPTYRTYKLKQIQNGTSLSYNSAQANNCDTVTFGTRLWTEKYAKNGIDTLRHQTSFFREIETDEILKKLLLENFGQKDKLKIISAGCSTGEEAVSFSMLLDDVKDKIQIIGIDLSKKSVKYAQSRHYILQKPQKVPSGYISPYNFEPFNDMYLWTPIDRPLTEQELKYKKLFEEYFEATDEIFPSQKKSIGQRVSEWFVKKYFKAWPLNFDAQGFRLRDGKAENCSFMQLDIRDIDKITQDEKAEAILFRNTIYHLITEDINFYSRQLKKDAEIICSSLIQKFRDSLCDGGYLVMGKDEALQTVNTDLVRETLLKYGFRPINDDGDLKANIWQKIKF